MNREAIAILESTLQVQADADLPPPVRTRRRMDPAEIVGIIRAGREMWQPVTHLQTDITVSPITHLQRKNLRITN